MADFDIKSNTPTTNPAVVIDEDEQKIKNLATIECDEQEEEDNDIQFEDWVEDEDDVVEIKTLFDPTVVSSVESLLEYDVAHYGFNFKEVIAKSCTDEAEVIMLINFIRARVAAIETIPDKSFIDQLRSDINTKSFNQPDIYMKPVIEDDPLLYLYEDTLLAMSSDD